MSKSKSSVVEQLVDNLIEKIKCRLRFESLSSDVEVDNCRLAFPRWLRAPKKLLPSKYKWGVFTDGLVFVLRDSIVGAAAGEPGSGLIKQVDGEYIYSCDDQIIRDLIESVEILVPRGLRPDYLRR